MPEETQPAQQCLFCAIDKGQISSYKVYEDDYVIAVLDIKPANPGHLLVFPKRHYMYITEMSVAEMSHLMNVSRTLMPVLMSVLDVKGINMLYSAGPSAGQKSLHFFINLIPRTENDGVVLSWKPKEVSEEQFKELQSKLIKTLSSFKEQPKEEQQPQEEQPPEQDPYYDIGDNPPRYW